MNVNLIARPRQAPEPAALLELLKPITWFPPMWAFLCGVVSSGAPLAEMWGTALYGMALAGPLVCGMSQAANDWCDRHVDAVNEPGRPIPSGRVPGRWGLGVALAMSALAVIAALPLGPWAIGATLFAVAAAWAYSAEPVRLKRSGWWGPGLVGLCYEGVPWFTGAAAVSGGAPDWRLVAVAALYALGAHGIMTLNDFKALEGDRRHGVASLPVTLGPARAARAACWIMAAPQTAVAALLLHWDRPVFAAAIALSLLAQAAAMRRLLRDPKRYAPWYNAVGVTLYVAGMMASAFALRGVAG